MLVEITRLSLNCSSVAASRILRKSTVTIGKITLCTLLKKTGIITNKAIITHVCIDTHAIIDMIASREQKEVAEWLKSYTNLHVVSKDGSITYRNAITEAHPDAI